MHDRMMLTFVLSHACPLKCNFCCSNREVVGPGRIGRAMMEDCLIGFGRERQIERFCFSGGDPFLFLEDIVGALETARGAGVTQPFQIVTSAYWASSPPQVATTIERLQGLGLDLIGLSYDREHARWVTPAQIQLVCDTAARLGIRVNMTGVFWDEGDSVQSMLPILAEHPARVRIVNLPVAPIGDARKQAVQPRFSTTVSEKLSCGQPGFYSLSIYPDGAVYPCCSGGFQIEGGLSCGNVHSDPPGRILHAASGNFHVRLVKEFGWGVLYELVAREAPELLSALPSLEQASGVCEVCRDLNRDLKDRLAPIYEPIEIEYARTRAEFEWRALFGDDPGTSRWFGERRVSLPALLDLLKQDRGHRLDYLAGLAQITAEPMAPSLSASFGRAAAPSVPATTARLP
jgi:pyruvate-formate lyase-activating enzyme